MGKSWKTRSLCLALLMMLMVPGIGGRAATIEDLNLALGKEAQVSTVWSDSYGANAAVDGDFETRWSAERDASTNQTLQVDLGSTVTFDQVVVADYSQRTQNYVIEVSGDGKAWEEVAYGEELGDQINQPYTITFDPVDARYVRLTIVAASAEPSIWEFQVYNSSDVSENNLEVPKPGSGTGTMAFTDINGMLTKNEVDSLVSFAERKYTTAQNNVGNAMAYGAAGADIDAMCMVYTVTQDTRLLAPMIKGADSILLGRNDQPNGDGRELFTGNVEKAWPNKALGEPDEKYAGSENGLVLGHVAYVAECILQTPSIWKQDVPDGDPNGYGKTYLERAQTYAAMCDETIQEFLIPNFIEEGTLLQKFPSTPSFANMGGASNYSDRAGSGFPWNQQWMFNHGMVHMAKVHELLGEEPEKVEQYRAIVQASLDWFLSQQVEREEDGQPCYTWSYWPKEDNFHQDGGKIEDAVDAHMAYDIAGLHLTMEYGYDNISQEHMQKFANTVKYIIYDESKAPNVFAGSVNGSDGKGWRSQLWPENIVLGIYDKEVYSIINTSAAISAATTGISRFGRTLYTKAQLFGIEEGVVGGEEEQPGETNPNNPYDPLLPPELDPNNAKTFADMQGHWAQQAVELASSAGIITGQPDGLFHPEDTVTRAEWTVMVARLLQLEKAQYQGMFQDVSADDWYATYVQAALDAGLIAQAKTFRPDEAVTREEMSKLAASAAVALGISGTVPEEFTLPYQDADSIGLWAVDSVRIVTYQEIMNGMADGRFAPEQYTTRAEAATVLSRMLAE